jgi:DNA-binding NarL/FixJ family response regulator
MTRTRVLFADDHAILIDALVNAVGSSIEFVGAAHNGRSAIELAKQTRPDVVVMDISMPELNGIDAARILHKEVSSAKLLFLTMYTDLPLLQEAFRAGASGYLLKVCGVEEFVNAVQTVAAGRVYISPLLAGDVVSTLIANGPHRPAGEHILTLRQREVLQLIAEGKTMKEVAARLNISTRTTESHKYEIMRHLGMDTTAELIRYAVRTKLV